MAGKIPAIGIDLGTTYCCVAFSQGGKVDIITNDQGNRTTPSYVAFTDKERLIGDAALDQVALNPQNTIFDAKRLIGRKFNDPNIQNDMKHWPFTVFNDSGEPRIEVLFKGKKKILEPEDVSSMILSKLKVIAEAYLGGSVQNAVITVPAYFNHAQRQATKVAATIAGFSVLRIINEPTAAVLSYELDKDVQDKKNVFVYDLGGGTFDVSIVTVSRSSQFDVKVSTGDTHLGGEDFDNRLVDHLIGEFKKKHCSDLRTNRRSLRRLRNAAEKAKRVLSSATEACINIDMLYNGNDFSIKISRARFEELCLDLFNRTIVLVEKALKDAKLDKSAIDDVVLVGGSTRIPKIKSLLQDFFAGKKLNISLNPDEAVAKGAAIQASILTENQDTAIKKWVVNDITPLSFGIETDGGIMSTIIERNTPIPCKKTEIYQTSRDYQTVAAIKVYQGERDLTVDNNLLGSFDLTDIPSARSGVSKIDVVFEINSNGILLVTAVEKSSKRSNTITIKNDTCRFTADQISTKIKEAMIYKSEDDIERLRISARNELESYLYGLRHDLFEYKEKLNEREKTSVRQKCTGMLGWLEGNDHACRTDYQSRLIQLKCCPIITKLQLKNDENTTRTESRPEQHQSERPAPRGGMKNRQRKQRNRQTEDTHWEGGTAPQNQTYEGNRAGPWMGGRNQNWRKETRGGGWSGHNDRSESSHDGRGAEWGEGWNHNQAGENTNRWERGRGRQEGMFEGGRAGWRGGEWVRPFVRQPSRGWHYRGAAVHDGTRGPQHPIAPPEGGWQDGYWSDHDGGMRGRGQGYRQGRPFRRNNQRR